MRVVQPGQPRRLGGERPRDPAAGPPRARARRVGLAGRAAGGPRVRGRGRPQQALLPHQRRGDHELRPGVPGLLHEGQDHGAAHQLVYIFATYIQAVFVKLSQDLGKYIYFTYLIFPIFRSRLNMLRNDINGEIRFFMIFCQCFIFHKLKYTDCK